MECSRCHGPNDRAPQRYCRDCHNAYSREWRAARGGYAGLTDEAKRKDNARSYLGVYLRRGNVKRETLCSRCRSDGPIEAHHYLGYDAPLDVWWLCRPCHRSEHSPQTTLV